MKALQRRIWEIMEGTVPGDPMARAWGIFISLLIVFNVLAVMCETVTSLASRFGAFFYYFEIFSVAVFTLEYVFRLFSCVGDRKYAHPLLGRMKFSVHWLSIIDVISVLPFYLPFLGCDLRFVRVLRLFRIVRLAKLGRYHNGIKLVANVFREKKEELVLSTIIMLVLLVFASSAIYYCERSAQPDEFPNIPASLWWAVVTLTTVGYGDVFPITAMGKCFAGIVAILGVGMFALPTGILGAGFVEEIQKRKQGKTTCPHCGKDINCSTTSRTTEPQDEE